MVFIKKLGRPIFTSHELATISGKSASTIVQSLNRLARQGLLAKIYRGVWAEAGPRALSPFEVIAHLFPRQRVYVSFISALHLHGILEQIPQVITLASTSHSSTICTKAGVFSIHQIAPAFFDGFDWYKGDGSFLIAEPEKALADYLHFVDIKQHSLNDRLRLKKINRQKLVAYAKLFNSPSLLKLIDMVYAEQRKPHTIY